MSCSLGPDEGPSRALCPSKLRANIARIEFAVVSKANCNLVWKLFSQCEEWNRYLNAYGKMQWLGERWAPGSRLQIELTYPMAAMQDRVITVCNPPRCVAWINHVLGYTMEQWVLFDPHPGGGTRISTWVEFTGATLHAQGHDIEAIVRDFVERWYTSFRDECDRMLAWV